MLGLALEQPVPQKVSDKVRVMWVFEGSRGERGVAKLSWSSRLPRDVRGVEFGLSARTSEQERMWLSLVRVACIL